MDSQATSTDDRASGSRSPIARTYETFGRLPDPASDNMAGEGSIPTTRSAPQPVQAREHARARSDVDDRGRSETHVEARLDPR